MPIDTTTSERSRIGLRLLGFLLLSPTLGCNQAQYTNPEGLNQRILPPLNRNSPEQLPTPKQSVPDGAAGLPAELGKPTPPAEAQAESARPQLSAQESAAGADLARALTLPEAIETAFRRQPRLRVYLEGIEQARRGEDIALAPFLPMAVAGYSVGGFNLNVAGHTLPTGPGTGFAFLPTLGSAPFGLNINTGYELADLKLQWLICDFGRRMGRYRQAGIATEIAQLQSRRAYQTVANEVSVAYYQVLRTRALLKTAREAVRRSQDDLEVAKKLAKGGALEKEKVLRAEVQLAESRRLLDATEGAEAVAIAALNLAIGLNVNAPTDVRDSSAIPIFAPSLTECLQTAVNQRREFQVARQSIQMADEGRMVAKADFAPRIVAEGALLDYQQSAPRGNLDLAAGGIKLEWGLFEGGKRVADMRIADSKIRAAVAQAETIADTIAFQVTEAYRHLVTARRGIERSRPAVTQSEENYRLVQARARQGDATSAEITDAESTLTRAQQDYLNSIHDYLIAMVRLEYAMGASVASGAGGH